MTTTAPRFVGLQDALAKVTAENGTRIARIRAAAAQAGGSGRLAAHQANNGKFISSAAARHEANAKQTTEPQPRAKIAGPVAGKGAAKAAPPPKAPWKVPAEIAAKGPGPEAGYRIVFEAVSDQLARMSKIPAAQGRVASLIQMVAANTSDADIRVGIGRQPTDRQMAIDAMWARAHAAVCRDRGMKTEPSSEASDGPKPTDAARQRMLAVAADPLFLGNEATALKLLTMEACYSSSTDDVLDVLAASSGRDRGPSAWDKIHAERSGQSRSAADDPHGWDAIHDDIRGARASASQSVWDKAWAAVAKR